MVEYPLRSRDLDEAFHALQQFWNPLLDGTADNSRARWSPDKWGWDQDYIRLQRLDRR